MEAQNLYKIGYTTKTTKELEKRYITSYPQLEIVYQYKGLINIDIYNNKSS